LWLATALLTQLPTGHDFRDLEDQQVDGHPVSEWRPLAAEQPDKAAAAAN
jgi:hypothetical protein